jgi:hypothetical protein
MKEELKTRENRTLSAVDATPVGVKKGLRQQQQSQQPTYQQDEEDEKGQQRVPSHKSTEPLLRNPASAALWPQQKRLNDDQHKYALQHIRESSSQQHTHASHPSFAAGPRQQQDVEKERKVVRMEEEDDSQYIQHTQRRAWRPQQQRWIDYNAAEQEAQDELDALAQSNRRQRRKLELLSDQADIQERTYAVQQRNGAFGSYIPRLP